MRGDDRSCRYPPRGVWLGLILASMTVCALLAQDAPDDEATRRLKEPVSLAANRVTHWNGPDGDWVHLWGNVAILQGTDAVVPRGKPSCGSSTSRRRSIRSRGSRFTPRGQVRSARTTAPPRPAARAVLQNSRDPTQVLPAGRPVRGQGVRRGNLQIIRRSGLRERQATTAVPSRRRRAIRTRRRSMPGSRLWPRVRQAFVSQRPSAREIRPIIRDAGGRTQSVWPTRRTRPQSGISSADTPAVLRLRIAVRGNAQARHDGASAPARPNDRSPVAAAPVAGDIRPGRPIQQVQQAQSAAGAADRHSAADHRLAADRRSARGPGSESHAEPGRPAAEHPAVARGGRRDHRAGTCRDRSGTEGDGRPATGSPGRAHHAGNPARSPGSSPAQRTAVRDARAPHHARGRGDVHLPGRHQHRHAVAPVRHDRYRG